MNPDEKNREKNWEKIRKNQKIWRKNYNKMKNTQNTSFFNKSKKYVKWQDVNSGLNHMSLQFDVKTIFGGIWKLIKMAKIVKMINLAKFREMTRRWQDFKVHVTSIWRKKSQKKSKLIKIAKIVKIVNLPKIRQMTRR